MNDERARGFHCVRKDDDGDMGSIFGLNRGFRGWGRWKDGSWNGGAWGGLFDASRGKIDAYPAHSAKRRMIGPVLSANAGNY
jgi:hypothetical protein